MGDKNPTRFQDDPLKTALALTIILYQKQSTNGDNPRKF